MSPIVYISPPTNVNLTPLPHLRGVFLTWEPGESYYGLPYPNISFFLKITYTVNDSEATPRLRVTGRVHTLAMDCLCDYCQLLYPNCLPRRQMRPCRT